MDFFGRPQLGNYDSFSGNCVYAHMYVLVAVSTYVLTEY